MPAGKAKVESPTDVYSGASAAIRKTVDVCIPVSAVAMYVPVAISINLSSIQQTVFLQFISKFAIL